MLSKTYPIPKFGLLEKLILLMVIIVGLDFIRLLITEFPSKGGLGMTLFGIVCLVYFSYITWDLLPWYINKNFAVIKRGKLTIFRANKIYYQCDIGKCRFQQTIIRKYQSDHEALLIKEHTGKEIRIMAVCEDFEELVYDLKTEHERINSKKAHTAQ